jgi:hypothetical protein
MANGDIAVADGKICFILEFEKLNRKRGVVLRRVVENQPGIGAPTISVIRLTFDGPAD